MRLIHSRIERACAANGRDARQISLLAVSKRQNAERMRALAEFGQLDFGENLLPEALSKQQTLADLALNWHFIGALQSNKTRSVANHFSWVHSVDRLRIAERLSAQRDPDLPALNVCVQVNISAESSKSGCAPDQCLALCKAVAELPNLKLRGLMTIPAPSDPPDPAPFQALHQLFAQCRAQGLPMDTVSAGMSADLEVAIAHGANLIRVGTALFGPRPT